MKYITTNSIYCIKQNLPFILVPGEMFEVLRVLNGRYHAVYKNEIILMKVSDAKDNFVPYNKEKHIKEERK